MTNRWKIAFIILLIISVTSIGLLGYTVIDQAVTINYASEGRADVEAHRDILDALIIGKLNLKDIRAANPKANHQANGYSHEVTYKDVRFQFDKQGRYIGSEQVNNPVRQSWPAVGTEFCASQRVTVAAKRKQGVRRPCD